MVTHSQCVLQRWSQKTTHTTDSLSWGGIAIFHKRLHTRFPFPSGVLINFCDKFSIIPPRFPFHGFRWCFHILRLSPTFRLMLRPVHSKTLANKRPRRLISNTPEPGILSDAQSLPHEWKCLTLFACCPFAQIFCQISRVIYLEQKLLSCSIVFSFHVYFTCLEYLDYLGEISTFFYPPPLAFSQNPCYTNFGHILHSWAQHSGPLSFVSFYAVPPHSTYSSLTWLLSVVNVPLQAVRELPCTIALLLLPPPR